MKRTMNITSTDLNASFISYRIDDYSVVFDHGCSREYTTLAESTQVPQKQERTVL